jgi:hypothetical protein
MIALRIFSFLLGSYLVAVTLLSSIKTFVLPRGAPSRITGVVFRVVRAFFNLRLKRADTYEEVDTVMALFAPTALLTVPLFWVTLIVIGYAGMFWGIGVEPFSEALIMSGSSLVTLGYSRPETLFGNLLSFSASTIGLGLVALLIAYLPAMYSAFSHREAAVTRLEVRAGDPPTAINLLQRAHRIHGLDHLSSLFEEWEIWFSELEESHTSLAAIVFFRSPQPERSWVTASGAVLDSAALFQAVVDRPPSPRAGLCIRSGYLALRAIADFFGIEHDDDPHYPETPIAVTREEFDAAFNELAAAGLPLVADRDQAWRDFAGWRVNYDAVLIALCKLTLAPYAPWSSDRSLISGFDVRDDPRSRGLVNRDGLGRKRGRRLERRRKLR